MPGAAKKKWTRSICFDYQQTQKKYSTNDILLSSWQRIYNKLIITNALCTVTF